MTAQEESERTLVNIPRKIPSDDFNLTDISTTEAIHILVQTVNDLIFYKNIRECEIERQKLKIQEEQQKEQMQALKDDEQSATPSAPNRNLMGLKTNGTVYYHSDVSGSSTFSNTDSNSNNNSDSSNDLLSKSPSSTPVDQYKFLLENYTDINFKRQKRRYDLDDHLKAQDNEESQLKISIPEKSDKKIAKNIVQGEEEEHEGGKEEPKDNNFNKSQTRQLFRKFNLKSKPKISIMDYVVRLQKYLKFGNTVMIVASYYIYNLIYFYHGEEDTKKEIGKKDMCDNTKNVNTGAESSDTRNMTVQNDKDAVPIDIPYLNAEIDAESYLSLTELNSYRIVLTTLRIATKLIEDLNFSSKFFAQICGIKVGELNKMETVMLFLLDFDLKVDNERLLSHLKRIRKLQGFAVREKEKQKQKTTDETEGGAKI